MPLDNWHDRSFTEDPLQRALGNDFIPRKEHPKSAKKIRLENRQKVAALKERADKPEPAHVPVKKCLNAVNVVRLTRLSPEEFSKDLDAHHLNVCEYCRENYRSLKGF